MRCALCLAPTPHDVSSCPPIAASGVEEDKVRKGDKVRFELDFDEGDGVMRLLINERDRGIVFRGA